MSDKRKRTILSVVGMVALLIACVIGVQAVFAGLGMVSAQNGGVSSSQSAQAEGRKPAGSGAGGFFHTGGCRLRPARPQLLPLLRRGPALLLPVGPVLSLLWGADRGVGKSHVEKSRREITWRKS